MLVRLCFDIKDFFRIRTNASILEIGRKACNDLGLDGAQAYGRANMLHGAWNPSERAGEEGRCVFCHGRMGIVPGSYISVR